jgi:hypothetical protein
MLWQGIFGVIMEMLFGIVNLLPTANATITASVTSFLTDFKTYVAPLNYIFPVGAFFVMLGSILVIEGGIFLYKSMLWVASHVSLGFIKK